MASPSILALPAELRIHIISYALAPMNKDIGFTTNPAFPGLILDEDYSPTSILAVLLTCRQFRADFTCIAFRSAAFFITDTYTPLSTRLQGLRECQIGALRHLAIVAGARQLREMAHWHRYPFNNPALDLDSLTVVLHRSAHWIYPSDFTTDMVALLRRLRQVRMLRFVRNGAHVKGFFKTWYNRLIGLVLKEDHSQRYLVEDAPVLEDVWWEWGFDDEGQCFELQAQKPRAAVSEEVYMEVVKPMVDKLMKSMEAEEEDPDPRVRNGWP